MKMIREAGRIIIHRHSMPDGDAIGAQAGLKSLVRDNFPGKEVYAVGDAPGRYSFIEGSEPDEVPDAMFEGALCVILDTASSNLVSDARCLGAGRTLRIDHHVFCEKFADVEIVDDSCESCCGLVARMALEEGLSISSRAASALYAGMVTDSGRFLYDGTSPATLRTAAALLERGVDTDALYRNLYDCDFDSVLLKARFAMRIRFTAHRVAYVYTSEEELRQMRADAVGVSRGLVNTMANIKGTPVWVNFTECDGKVLCELRSSGPAVNLVAARYGGGGHLRASGAAVADRAEAMRMLDDLDRLAAEGGAL